MSLLSALLLSAFPAGPEVVPLSDRSLKEFDLNLPADAWHPVTDLLPIPHAGGAGFAVRPAGVGLELDTDGDGELDRVVEGTFDELTLERSAWVRLEGQRADGSPLQYAVRLLDKGEGWHWAASGCVQGRLGDTRIRVVDLNGDGRFDGIGQDGMILGGGRIASLLSSVVHLDGQLRNLAVATDGSSVTLTDYAGATGGLDAASSLETDGKLLSAVVVSADRQVCFDLALLPAGAGIPVGEYRIAFGMLGLGRARVSLGPGRSEPIRVSEGGEQVLEWGGPVDAEFRYSRQGGQVLLSPDEVWYYGAAGEEYFGWTPIGKSPEFTIRERAAGTELEKALFPGSC